MDNDDCVICFEPVTKQEKHTVECECKYTVHKKCIEQWNEKCLMCNKPTATGMVEVAILDRREIIIERALIFGAICGVLCFIYVVLKDSYKSN